MSESAFNLLEDVYYNKCYARLYADSDSSVFDFEYREGNKIFKNLAIKKQIKSIGNHELTEDFYDLETPYGYGGYYVNCDCRDFISKALNLYKQRCLDENIIAEFIRFHPFNDFHVKYPNFADFLTVDRNVVVVDLTLSQADRWKHYSEAARRKMRKKDEYTIRKSDNLGKFVELYVETMKRNGAEEFYFFNDRYWKSLFELPEVELVEVLNGGEVITMALFMFGKDFGHYHLAGNAPLSYQHNGNYYAIEHAFKTAKDRGCKYFMLGGGKTGNPEDSLLRFKKQFSNILKDFRIAGVVFNQEKYHEYIRIWENQSKNKGLKYFLKYRVKIQ